MPLNIINNLHLLIILTAAHRLTHVTRSERFPASVNNVYSSNAYPRLKYTDYVTRDSMINGISDKTLCHNDKIKKVAVTSYLKTGAVKLFRPYLTMDMTIKKTLLNANLKTAK